MNILRLTSTLSSLEAPAADSDGLWQTYDGTALIMPLSDDEIGALYVDLDTLTIPEQPPALDEHDPNRPVGWWSAAAIVTAPDNGQALAQRLHLLPDDPSGPATEAHWNAAALRHLLAAGMPLQASICVQPNPNGGADARWQAVTEPTLINGRRIGPANHLPLPTYVLRHGLNRETSVCVMGQAVSTGKIAASLKAAAGSRQRHPITPQPAAERGHHPEPVTMDIKDRMDALLAEHGDDHKTRIMQMLIDGKTDDDITAAISAAKDHAKDQEIDDLKASLKASQDDVARITASSKPSKTPSAPTPPKSAP